MRRGKQVFYRMPEINLLSNETYWSFSTDFLWAYFLKTVLLFFELFLSIPYDFLET